MLWRGEGRISNGSLRRTWPLLRESLRESVATLLHLLPARFLARLLIDRRWQCASRLQEDQAGEEKQQFQSHGREDNATCGECQRELGDAGCDCAGGRFSLDRARENSRRGNATTPQPFRKTQDERRQNPGLELSGIQELAVLDRGVRALFVILHQPEAPTDKRRQVLIARLFLFQEFLHLRF